MRATFKDFRNSGLPGRLGECVNNTPQLLAYVNEAIQRLILEDEGQAFWRLNARMAFTVVNNYATAPRDVARITDIAVCAQPVRIQNQFYEFLQGGEGLQPPNACEAATGAIEAIDRGTTPIMGTLPATNQYLRAYLTDVRDVGKNIFVSGVDQNGLVIREQHVYNWDNGFNLTLEQPFTTSSFIVTAINGIQKDVTYGDVVLYAVDATTGVETLLSRYAADETRPDYRRYYLNHLPTQCCSALTPVQVIGMVKLEYVPVTKDSDFLLIGNLVALKEECQAIYYSDMETKGSQQLSDRHHKAAIRLLNNELKHYEGAHTPAINVAIYGTAHLSRHGIGIVR